MSMTRIPIVLSLCAALVILGVSTGVMVSVDAFDDIDATADNQFGIVAPLARVN